MKPQRLQDISRKIISILRAGALQGTLLFAGLGLFGASIEESMVFAYPQNDPFDRANDYGVNHAPSITTLANGTLFAAWWSGPYEASHHQVVLGAESNDGGKTWSPAKVMGDFKHLSDFDPAFVTNADSTWLFFAVGRFDRYPVIGGVVPGMRDLEGQRVGPNSFRIYARKTSDSGQHWSDPGEALISGTICRSNGITLSDGTMLLPLHTAVGTDGRSVSSVFRSLDKGITWNKVGSVKALDGFAGEEPAIVQLQDGSVLMALRSNDGHIWFSFSQDKGDTWSSPFPSEFDAAQCSAALFRTRNGRVLLSYNDCKPPQRTPLVIRELDQKSMKWGEPMTVAMVAADKANASRTIRQVCYPSMTETHDGVLVVIWTDLVYTADTQQGTIRCARIKL